MNVGNELCSQLADALHSSMELDFEAAKNKGLKPLPILLPNMDLCQGAQELGMSHLLADLGTGRSWCHRSQRGMLKYMFS